MGKGITPQQAQALGLLVDVALADGCRAMDLDRSDCALALSYRAPISAELITITITPAGKMVAPEPTVTTGADGDDPLLYIPDAGEKPAQEGVDFIIADPNKLRAQAAAEGKTVAEVVTPVPGSSSPTSDEFGAINPAVAGPIEDI